MCWHMGWIGFAILQVAQKVIVRIQFLSYFWNPLIKSTWKTLSNPLNTFLGTIRFQYSRNWQCAVLIQGCCWQCPLYWSFDSGSQLHTYCICIIWSWKWRVSILFLTIPPLTQKLINKSTENSERADTKSIHQSKVKSTNWLRWI